MAVRRTRNRPQLVVSLDAASRGAAFSRVACGDSHSAAVAKDGSLYCWGSNMFGQLGFEPDDEEVVQHPCVIAARKRVQHKQAQAHARAAALPPPPTKAGGAESLPPSAHLSPSLSLTCVAARLTDTGAL
jgi:hypothetical protein